MNSDLVGNSAPGWQWKGHRVRLLDGLALARFEREVFSRHWAALQEVRKLCTPRQYDRQLTQLREAKAAGLHGLTGAHGQALLATRDGAALLLELILDYDGTSALDGAAVLFADPQGAGELVKQVLIDSGIAPPAAVQGADRAGREKGKCASAP